MYKRCKIGRDLIIVAGECLRFIILFFLLCIYLKLVLIENAKQIILK